MPASRGAREQGSRDEVACPGGLGQAFPSLRYLKLEAKRRLAAGEFPSLHDVQGAIAMEHGQPSWAALKQFISGQATVKSHPLAHLERVIAFGSRIPSCSLRRRSPRRTG